MNGKRTRTEARVSLAIVPVRDGADLLGPAIGMFAGLSTWLAVSGVEPGATRSPDDLQRIGATKGARYVLHGWTDSERGRLRLTVERNEAASGRMLWSDRLDRPASQRELLRDEAADRIGRAVGPMLLRRELERLALQPAALTSQDQALRAFDAIMRPKRLDGFVAAGRALKEAADGHLTDDGELTGVWFALVWWHLIAISQGWGGDLVRAAEAAAVLNRADPTAAALAMYVQAVTRRDYTAALTALDRSQLCGTAGCLKALALCWMGDARGAVAHAEQAVEMPALGPEVAWRNYVTALANYVAGQYDDAVWWCRESARHHPGLAANARVLAASQAVLGRLDEALQVATQVLVIDPGFRIAVWRKRSLLPADCRDATAQRLRLAGLPA